MRDTLKNFTTESLEKASGVLLKKLNIKYTPLVEGVTFDKYFEQNDFSYQYVEDVKQKLEHIWHIGFVNDETFKEDTASANNSTKADSINIFACEIKPEEKFTRSLAVALTRAFNRVSTRKVNFNYDMPVVVIMRQGTLLSIATCERSERADGLGEKVGKVTILRNMDCKNLHAGHRQILERIAKDVSGSSSYDELHKKWFASFSIDVLSDKFFNEYKAIYEDIIEYVTGKRMVKDGNKWIEHDNGKPCKPIMDEFKTFPDPEKAVRDYVKNLMGRLVFIQFLQKKGWMGVPAGDNWENGDQEFLQNLFKNSDKKETFIDDVLEPLFNDLNTKRHSDLVTNHNVSQGRSIKMPYLNGGLFELDESDDTKFPLPSSYMQQLFDFFASYNFTIDENAPDDVEIGVDPEMLGRIFENLLEDNKDKGAYYTPKKIVQYMCRESLIAYLTTRVMKKQGENHRPEEEIRNAVRKLLSEPENVVPKMTKEHLQNFGTYIREVKICDPAIGSGAFPMGLLNELVRCRTIIKAWATDSYGNMLVGNIAALKAEIIRNNIYGVDIEKGAIDIARLRFWLSIIVDEKTPEALPNFDYKFMQGNSLIPTFAGQYINLSTKNQQHKYVQQMKQVKKKIYKFKQDFYSASGVEKMKLNILIKDHILQLISFQLGYEIQSWAASHKEELTIGIEGNELVSVKQAISQLPEDRRRIVEVGKSLREQLADESISLERRAQIDIQFFDWRMMFTEVFDVEDGGFDIVIGNPPYINIANLKDEVVRKLYQKHYKTVKNKCDLYSIFTEKSYDLMRNNGICSFIFSNSWMGTDSFSLFRHFLIEKTRIINLVDLPDKVFRNATVRTCIILFSKEIADNHTINLYDYDGVSFERLNNSLSYADIKQFDHYPFSFEKVIDLYRVKHQLLKNIASFTLGIKTSNDKRFISSQPFEEDSYKLIRGRHIRRYNTPIANEWIWYRPDLFMEKTGAGPRKLEYFLVPSKIIIQDVAQEICATIDENQYLCNDTINVIYSLSEGFSFKYVLGIINSKAVRYWHKILFPEGLHIKKYQLEVIPIPIVSNEVQSSVVDVVDSLIDLQKNDANSDIVELEARLDRIVYELFNLSNAEVKRIDPTEKISGSDEELFKA